MSRETKKLEVRTNVVFSRDDHKLIKDFASQQGVSFGQFIRQVVTRYVRLTADESPFLNPPLLGKKRKSTPALKGK